ncbi:hypothetical protein JQM83_14490 [Parabacteroides distasonis]|nr:hypothetical protein [Parabacteroides distasonis]MCI6876265.1 hypothetical protein [Parabacteroides sp.]MDD7722800.1 hypothetical protein [bacterium]
MKKTMLLVGAIALLSGMGLNLQYALDDYELADNRMIALWADGTKTGDDGSGTGNTPTGCDDCNLAGGAGATSCSCTTGSISALGISATGKGCDVSTGSGYYSCCRVTMNGACKCPSCPNN